MNKKLFAILLLSVFILAFAPLVSAELLTFDNKLIYTEDEMVVTITNTFGLGKDYGTVELKSHKTVDEVLQFGFGKEEVVMYYDFINWELYENGLGEVIFINERTGKEIQKDYYFVEWVSKLVEINDYKEICVLSKLNTSSECSNEIIGTHLEEAWSWERLNTKDIPNRNTRIGLKTYVGKDDYIDAIWTIAGKEIDKHASWSGGLTTNLLGYWSFEETSGTTVNDVHSTSLDGTSGGDITLNIDGKIGKAYQFNGDGGGVNWTTGFDYGVTGTIAMWMKATTLDAQLQIWSANGEVTDTNQGYLNSANKLAFHRPASAPATPTALENNTWYFVVYEWTPTSRNLIVNNGDFANVSSTAPGGGVFGFYLGWKRAANGYLGLIDEMGYWERTLSGAELTELYNYGLGCTYDSCISAIILNSPENNTFSSTSIIKFNGTTKVTRTNVTLIIDDTYNETDTSGGLGVYNFTKTLSEGSHTWNMESCTTTKCVNATERTLTIDYTNPTITSAVLNASTIYNIGDLILLNTTITDTNLNTCWYDYNGINTTIDGCLTGILNQTAITTIAGKTNITVWANDSAGNEATPINVSFVYDTIAPTITIESPVSIYDYLYQNYNLTLNTTITDTNLDTCLYDYNNTNTTFSCSTGVKTMNHFNYQSDFNNITIWANDSAGNIVSETVSWDYLIFDEQEYIYNTEVVESETQTIKGKFKIPGDVENIYLRYNGDLYAVSINTLADSTYEFYSTLIAPAVLVDTNKTFNFLINGINTANITQLIQSVNLDNCAVYTNEILNLTLKDEEIFNSLTGKIYVNFQVIDGSDNVIADYQNKDDSGHSIKFCSSINLTDTNLYLNAEIEYETENYSREFYHIQKGALSNYPRVLYLYNIKLDDSTTFKIIYQSIDLTKISNAVVQLQRKYTYLNEYRIVEAPLTSSDSEAIIHVDTDSVKYKITIAKDGEIISTFDNLVFQCDNELYGICEQKLLEPIIPVNLEDLETLRDFQYSITTNKIVKKIQVDFATPSATPREVTMITLHRTIAGTSTICNKTITSSAGSLICNYEDTIEDSHLIVFVYLDGNLLVQKGYKITEDLSDYFNGNNFIIVFIIGLSLIFMSMSSPEWIILNSVLTIVGAGALWLINGMDLVIGLGSLFWVIGAGLILILKTSKQEDN